MNRQTQMGSNVRNRNTHATTFLALIAATALALSVAGCAKMADPQPPEVRIPRPAIDLSARQLSDFVVLTVSKPVENTDGSPATTLAAIEVLRLATPVGNPDSATDTLPLPGDQFAQRAVRVLSIPGSSIPAHLKGEALVIEDRFPPEQGARLYESAYRYAVLFINNKRQTAGLSNQAYVRPLPIPPPPAGLSADVSQDAIRLRWTAPQANMDGSEPPRIFGYHIFRSETPDGFPAHPLSARPIRDAAFDDRDFRFDTTYYYSISTVGVPNPPTESLRSTPLVVVARDLFPPDPPEDFSALREDGVVVLLWAPSPSQDVAGYRVYRRERVDVERRLLQERLIEGLSFRDAAAPAGRCQYMIIAVDTHGNESVAGSAEVERIMHDRQ